MPSGPRAVLPLAPPGPDPAEPAPLSRAGAALAQTCGAISGLWRPCAVPVPLCVVPWSSTQPSLVWEPAVPGPGSTLLVVLRAPFLWSPWPPVLTCGPRGCS